jgi:chromate reductase
MKRRANANTTEASSPQKPMFTMSSMTNPRPFATGPAWLGAKWASERSSTVRAGQPGQAHGPNHPRSVTAIPISAQTNVRLGPRRGCGSKIELIAWRASYSRVHERVLAVWNRHTRCTEPPRDRGVILATPLCEASESIMRTWTVGYLIGSIAKASINRQLAGALLRLAPANMKFREVPIAELPLYSYDYDADFPPPAKAFKEALAAVDAVLFVTPEYNRSIPGALKNAIDWASRPYGQNSFTRKPAAVIGTSPGKIGTAVGQQHLRSILGFCNAPQMNSVEAYIQWEKGLVDESGNVTNKETETFLRKYMQEFHDFIVRVDMALPKDA